ncbi:Sigma-70 region 2 [Hoylesella saccharolytica F0055]|jgi:RNA polymerase sigma factor, sigma-70 family|uniref:Sigma-70 region 2 n=2 Tax=Hoylesella TaxID=2974257 RepID=L1N8P0_9BACT|nr:sigma-70 family RNA polymerase sigma factor [Hoylesella saccharolytica]EKX99571.1 Sigma-70 region 2 [Hoylesella saccharolytica F0055]
MMKLNEMTDEELAMSYVSGNNMAFDLLLTRNQSNLFSYILFIVHDRDVANDLFQETFVKVITKLQQGKYTTTGKFSAWIIRIAHNVIMDWYRSQKSGKVIEFANDNDLSNISNTNVLDATIESKFVNEQILCDVKKMMNYLPVTQREVIFMRFYQDLSFKEIATLTNVSINTALGRMRYAVMNLRRMAQNHDIALQLD